MLGKSIWVRSDLRHSSSAQEFRAREAGCHSRTRMRCQIEKRRTFLEVCSQGIELVLARRHAENALRAEGYSAGLALVQDGSTQGEHAHRSCAATQRSSVEASVRCSRLDQAAGHCKAIMSEVDEE